MLDDIEEIAQKYRYIKISIYDGYIIKNGKIMDHNIFDSSQQFWSTTRSYSTTGKRIWKKRYHSNGTLYYKITYNADGGEKAYLAWYPNGAKRLSIINGDSTEFYQNGRVKSKDTHYCFKAFRLIREWTREGHLMTINPFQGECVIM